MNGLIRTIIGLAVAGIASILTAAPASAEKGLDKSSLWHPWFEVGGYHNSRDEDTTGTSGTNRGETTIFAPIRGSERGLLFGQLTAKFFDDTAKEGNVAFGYRRMMRGGFNLGAWLGGDVRRSAIDNPFWQLSGGFEALSENLDIRFNWYGPVTAPKAGRAGFAQVQLQGHEIFMTGGQEVGLMGVDGEIGVRLPTEYLALDPSIFELRAYAGGYYFDHADAAAEVAGVKGRLEFRVNDFITALPGSRLTAEYEVSHDDVRSTRHDVGLRIRIPLSGSKPTRSLASLSPQQRRMLDGVERDTDIVTGRSKAEPVEDALTGTHLERVAFANASTDVTTASSKAGPNSLIIVNGEVTGGQTLQGDQTLQGGGSAIQVRGRRSGTLAPFIAPGAAGRLTTPGAQENSLTLGGSNAHVAGITIVGDPNVLDPGDGVRVGSDRRGIFLNNLNVCDIGDDGIDIARNNHVTIIGVSVAHVTNDGIRVLNDNSVAIIDSNVSKAGEENIDINNRNHVRIERGRIVGAQLAGVAIGNENTVTIVGTTIVGPDDNSDGIQIGDDNTVSLDNVAILGRTEDAIEVNAGNTLMVSALTVQGADYAIWLEDVTPGNGNTATVTDSVFSNLFGDVFYIGTYSTLSVMNSLVDGPVNEVFGLGESAALLVRSNVFSGIVNDKLFDFEGPGVTVLPGSTRNINNATVLGEICDTSGGGSFTGFIGFVDGTVLVDNAAPCN